MIWIVPLSTMRTVNIVLESKRKIQHIYKKCPTYEKIKS